MCFDLRDDGLLQWPPQIRESNDQILVGAMTTHADIASSKLLQRSSPLLSQAATQIGDTQVRNRGTIGGSLAQAHPGADRPHVLAGAHPWHADHDHGSSSGRVGQCSPCRWALSVRCPRRNHESSGMA